jgi:ribonuclease III
LKTQISSSLSKARIQKLQELSEHLKIPIYDYSIYHEAFTHKSYSNENKDYSSNNERLEFLGDSVLGFIISKNLFLKFPNYSEGELSKLKSRLVSGVSLSSVSERLQLTDFLLLGHGEKMNHGEKNKSNQENLFESLLGAIFLDSGIETVENFILDTLDYKEIKKSIDIKDYQTLLQEFTQKKYKTLPVYEVISEEGPDHDKVFTIKVQVGNRESHGKGASKQKAKQDASKNLLSELRLA